MTFQVEMDKLIKEKRLYFLGDALPPDWYAAFKIWLPMAEAGDPKAQYNVGRCYDQGEGVDKDKNKAKEWYLKAAEQDDPRAFFNLYLFYSNKKSEEKNLEKAEYFFKRAADAGEVRAIQAIRNNRAKQEKQLFLEINEIADAKLSEFLKNSDNEKAISFINEINDPRLIWLRDYLPLLSCEYFEHGDGSFILKNNSSECCFFRWPDMQVPAYKETKNKIETGKNGFTVKYQTFVNEFRYVTPEKEWVRWRRLGKNESFEFGIVPIFEWSFDGCSFTYVKKEITINFKQAKDKTEAKEAKEVEEASPFREITDNPEKIQIKKVNRPSEWLNKIVNIVENFSEFKQSKNNRDKKL